ncbi:outer membrane protein assembly factor BamB family protein [Streptomyces xanthii]|uniref:PQQ-binding-like beta-propeller repeat protein n=1 Tax=Streptomyces xanthii TaxID=2768069 RepID=A0A7H1B2K5_9ACTN|nr:PQQ-binding-like beta-propeller repeat protein [Streptomyces xanthii]QNS02960.1 PQQ-binding-like beta-propeller repeat protein [Streptomyces xanthii]
MMSRWTRTARWARHAGYATLLTLTLLLLAVADGDSGPQRQEPVQRPNALEVEWSLRTPGRALDAADTPASVNDSMLAIPLGATVGIVDTREGRRLSTLRGAGSELEPAGFSGGVMFAMDRQGSEESLNAYDPATGKKLWRETASRSRQQKAGNGWTGTAPSLPAPGPVVEAVGGRLAGLDPQSGAVRWRKRIPAVASCGEVAPAGPGLPSYPPYQLSATDNYVVVLGKCPGLVAELQVMDARDGGVVWKRRLEEWREYARIDTSPHAIVVSFDDEFRVFTEAGKEHARGRKDRKPAPMPDDPSGDVAVGDAGVAGAYVGDLRWSVGDARLQGPGASSLTDRAGRRSPSVPWPVAGTFVGRSGHLLIVRSEERYGTRYTALRPRHRAVDRDRPAGLGGAARKDWPDACGLVRAGLLQKLGRDYVKLPVRSSRTVMGVRLPHPSVCRFATESGSDDDIFSVTVRWVAPDEEAARTYATSGIPWGCDPPLGGCVLAQVTTPRPGVHLYTYRTGLEQSPVAHATVVAGRHVFGISTGNDTARARWLVARVATHLSDLNGGGRALAASRP